MTTAPNGLRSQALQEWLDDHEITHKAGGDACGVSQQRFSEMIKDETIPEHHHKTLVGLGVPSHLLPRPESKKRGRPPKIPRWPALAKV